MIYELMRAFGPVAAILLFVALVLLYRRIYRFTHRPPGQVIAYLRAVDPGEVGHLLDPKAEQYLRFNLGKEQFRKEQRNRMRLALEYIGRLSHNGLVMAEWGFYELKRVRRTGITEDRETCLDLVSASIQVRMCSFVLRLRIHLWLVRMAVLPFASVPSFQNLVNVGSTDLLVFYRQMRSAASLLGQSYGGPFHQELALALQPLGPS
ncbi:MAG TPA: hypothetical protein VLT16_01220 [Candidatus Limnocylindrales bacterium]|nr:hypothetical protein [Candidatus Limnocylindrales bacterium]